MVSEGVMGHAGFFITGDQAAVRLLEGARAVNLAADTLSQGSKALSANTGRFQLK